MTRKMRRHPHTVAHLLEGWLESVCVLGLVLAPMDWIQVQHVALYGMSSSLQVSHLSLSLFLSLTNNK